ncbi:MAG TPA: response regulator [Labilithrix sp.]|nr:response regulator [Labilithrix sp.]
MMTILLVDVVDADAAILASALRVEGFDVIVAKTAKDAREVLTAQPVALTIIDLMLRTEGGANGLELARELRLGYPAMRVLLTSSYHLSERQLERADCGVSGFIPKPYDLREVVEFVRTKVSAPPSSRRLWCAEPGSGISARFPHIETLRTASADDDRRR